MLLPLQRLWLAALLALTAGRRGRVAAADTGVDLYLGQFRARLDAYWPPGNNAVYRHGFDLYTFRDDTQVAFRNPEDTAPIFLALREEPNNHNFYKDARTGVLKAASNATLFRFQLSSRTPYPIVLTAAELLRLHPRSTPLYRHTVLNPHGVARWIEFYVVCVPVGRCDEWGYGPPTTTTAPTPTSTVHPTTTTITIASTTTTRASTTTALTATTRSFAASSTATVSLTASSVVNPTTTTVPGVTLVASRNDAATAGEGSWPWLAPLIAVGAVLVVLLGIVTQQRSRNRAAARQSTAATTDSGTGLPLSFINPQYEVPSLRLVAEQPLYDNERTPDFEDGAPDTPEYAMAAPLAAAAPALSDRPATYDVATRRTDEYLDVVDVDVDA